MSDVIYDDVMRTESKGMKTERVEMMVDIYESADAVRDHDFRTETNTHQPLQRTGSDSVRNRSSRAAAVCLALLCVLLLTAVIVLCVHIHIKSTNYTEERNKLLNKITKLTEERDGLIFTNKNLTNERDQLIFTNKNLTNERDQQIFTNKNLTNERDQLIFTNKNLTNERDQLIFTNKNLTNERDQLIFTNKNLTNERYQLIFTNKNLTNERDQLIFTNKNLTNERDQLRNELQICAEWTCYQSSSYYISKEKKNWTESRRYCTERGADLIIINNTEEQDFVKNMSGAAAVWIGLTDSEVENTWKWVDGSTLTSGFWASRQPFGGTTENCAVTVPLVSAKDWDNSEGWHDEACKRALQWICEKRISQLILP